MVCLLFIVVAILVAWTDHFVRGGPVAISDAWYLLTITKEYKTINCKPKYYHYCISVYEILFYNIISLFWIILECLGPAVAVGEFEQLRWIFSWVFDGARRSSYGLWSPAREDHSLLSRKGGKGGIEWTTLVYTCSYRKLMQPSIARNSTIQTYRIKLTTQTLNKPTITDYDA